MTGKVHPDAVTRAMCATLGYDPDGYDLETVPGPFAGVRVVTRDPRTPVRGWRKAAYERMLAQPDFAAAFKANLEIAHAEHRRRARARKVIAPVANAAAVALAWLATGWKVAARGAGRREAIL